MKPHRYRIGRIWCLFCISFATVEASNKGPMLPRRGYEPVDDAEGDSPQDETRDYGASGLRSGYTSIPSNGPSDTNADQREPAPSSADGTSRKAVGIDSDDTEGSMTVRVLDVQGQTYKLRVRPETRVGELKARLLEIAGVEIARQRIIWSGQILKDSDTLSSRKVIDGAAMHLFQRPKNAPVVSGIGTSNAPQPNGRTEIPSMMLQVQGSTASDESQNQVLLDEHWEVETPRRTMRFLASVLILISIMQFLECLSRVSAAMASSGGGKGDDARLVLSSDEWNLVRDRTISSVVGIVVGLMGVYGALSLSTRIIRLYLAGLAMCFVIAMYIQLEFLFDVSTGKIPFDDYDTGSSSDHHPDDGDEDDGNDGDDDEGHDSSHGSATQRTLYLKIFNALIGVLLSGGIWVICLVRIYFVRMEIEIYMENRERQLREIREEEERHRVSTARLEEGEAAGSDSLTS